ncbi:MAG: hypothetical protein ACTTIR_05960 [Eggerthia catenaformis]|uniref:hypothetical protein n=1 Tax=Eggerthia catenaformis TaxID=31973 RepID=UPI003FA09C4D
MDRKTNQKLMLRAEMLKKSLTFDDVSKELDISVTTFNSKLNDFGTFKLKEILTLQKLLDLSISERNAIFFGPLE